MRGGATNTVEGRGSRVEGSPIPAARLSTQLHCVAIFLQILEITVNRLHAALQRRFKLREIAYENDQLCRSGRRKEALVQFGLRTSDFGFDPSLLTSAATDQNRPPFRLRAQPFQFGHHCAPQPVQFADWQQHLAGQRILQLAELERRPAETT